MKITQFKTSDELELDGVWVDIGDGAKLRVARVGNPRYRKRLRELSKPYKRQIRLDKLPEDMGDALVIQAFAETILLDWEGIEDEDGKDIKYSTAEAKRLMTELRDFRELVAEIAMEMETFRAVEAEEEGNSSRSSSDGTSSTEEASSD